MSEAIVTPPVDTELLMRTAYPVSFRIINEKREEKIYLEEKPASGFLELRNDSGRDLHFVPSNPGAVTGPDFHHFALKFRPGILRSDLKTLIKHRIIKNGWTLSLGLVSTQTGKPVQPGAQALEETSTVLYFLNQDRRSFRRGEKIILPLKHLRLQADEGTQATQVELACRGLARDPEHSRVIAPHIRHFSLTLINHRGKPHMPIHVGFTGFNTIVNDGSANKLVLRITNLQKKTHHHEGTFTFSRHKRSRMFLFFETDTENSDYSLGTVDDVAGIELDIKLPNQSGGSSLVHEPLFQGNNPVWEIYPEDGDVVLQPHHARRDPSSSSYLPDDSCLDVVLSNIRSESLMGTTHLYLRLENIPGYWDHTYAIPIVKQPMTFRRAPAGADYDQQVAIGSAYSRSKLEVHGVTEISCDTTVGGQLTTLTLRVSGESPGKGKLLSSDADGLTTWKSGVGAGAGTAMGFGKIICSADIASSKGALILFTGRLSRNGRDFSMLLHIDPNNEVSVMLATHVDWNQSGDNTSVVLSHSGQTYRIRFSRQNTELVLTYEGGGRSEWIQGNMLVVSNTH